MPLPDRYYEDLLRSVIAGSDWIVGMDVAVPAARTAAYLRGLGARSVLAVGAGRGSGELPTEIETVVVGMQSTTMMQSIRDGEALLDDLPPRVCRRIEDFDPDSEARCIRALYSHGRPIAGRRVWGARRPEWVALEDKTVVDALWDHLKVPRAPSEIVPVTAEALADAHGRLDRGLGTVFAGDNTSGWHGGASFTRWVRDDADLAGALQILAPACRTARVMPFLEGIPCSIHGIVFDEHVVALEPCEMLVLRGENPRRLIYAAAATSWRPRAEDRDALRALARRVGAHLRERVSYRGVFTLDGVMSAQGFRPTELNPRFGAAIHVLTRGIRGLPTYLLHCAIVEREPLDFRPAALEALICSKAMGQAEGRAGTLVAGVRREQATLELSRHGDEFRAREPGDAPPDARLTIGPHPSGCYVNIDLLHLPIGPPAAPIAAAALRFADRAFALGLGPVTPATDMRP